MPNKTEAPLTRTDFAALWASDRPTMEIALICQRSTTNVQQWAKRFGLPPRPESSNPRRKQSLRISKNEFCAMWNKGVPTMEICAKAGITRAVVERLVKEFNLKKRGLFREERLPEIKADFVRWWNDPQVTTRVMARRLNVHKGTIRKWARALGLQSKPVLENPDEYEEGPLPGDPSPKEIAERAAECRARRELAKAQAEW